MISPVLLGFGLCALSGGIVGALIVLAVWWAW